MGRRAYSAKNLLEPAIAKSPAGSAAPILGPPTTSSPEWLTKEELLIRLNIRETFFNGLMKRGKIPHRRYSRKLVRFDPVKVEAALTAFDVGVVK